MRKSLFISLALSLCAAVAPGIHAAVPAYDQEAALASARADVANWQKYLPDEVYVAHVSIPGTHDAATAHEWASATGPTYSTTQEKTLAEQLAGGIRAFDFRPGMTDGILYCNHGTDRLKLTLDEAFTVLTDYLDAHPSEFYVIHLFRGNIFRLGEASFGNKLLGAKDDAASIAQYNELFNQFFNQGKFADYIVDYTPYLKVSDIRGKMVIFRRDRIDFAHIAKAGNLTNWPGDTEQWTINNTVAVSNASDPTVKGRILATDVSSPADEAALTIELSSLSDLFGYNCAMERPNDVKQSGRAYKPDWTMMFTSGAYKGENTDGYLRNATYTNPHFTSMLRTAQQNGASGPTGAVFSDWVLTDSHSGNATMGVDLVPAIYENNFYYIKDFILDDELFSASDAESYWEDGCHYFMRNVGTGELLSAGADWGTHAVLGRYGIRITPVFDAANNLYSLHTTFTQGGAVNGIGDNYYVDNVSPAEFTATHVGGGHFVFTLADRAMGAARTGNTYADGTEYIVDGVEIDYTDPMQQWEVIKVDDYFKTAIAEASSDNGVDVSYMIRGHRFLPNDGDNPKNGASATWTGLTNKGTYLFKTYESVMECDGTNSWNDKELVLHIYNKAASGASKYTNWELTNSIAGLPAGKYNISFNAIHSNALATNGDYRFNINGESVKSSIKAIDCTSAADAVAYFRSATNGEYTVSLDFVLTEGQTLEFDMYKAGTSTETHLFLDNITLVYYGPEEATVEWAMEGDVYDTLILPFDAELPEGYEACLTEEMNVETGDDYHVLKLLSNGREIKANVPYIVKKTGLGARGAEVLSFTGVPVNERDSYTVGVLTGTHVDIVASPRYHVLAHSAEGSWFSLDAPRAVSAAHAYISNDDTPDYDFSSPTVYIEKAMDDSDVPTGIEAVIAPDERVAVYTVTGVMLRSDVEASRSLEGLDGGVYIIRGANAIIKTLKR